MRKNDRCDNRYRSKEEVDELVELMIEVMMMPEDSMIRIARSGKASCFGKKQVYEAELFAYRICAVLSESEIRPKVGNIKAYLLTAQDNAPATINSYYQAEVNHDMYGG